jgi:hypothetical protein
MAIYYVKRRVKHTYYAVRINGNILRKKKSKTYVLCSENNT